jgi:hypothetical protein
MWRRIGLSEQAALDTVIEDGLVPLSDHDRAARALRKTFNLSESQAEAAARGRHPEPPKSYEDRVARSLQNIFGLTESQARAAAGPDTGSVSEVSLATIAPHPENIPFVVAAIQERATEIYRRGVSEERAYHDAAVDVMLAAPDTPNDRTSDWVLKIAHTFWPQAFESAGSSGSSASGTAGKSVSESPARKPGPSGRRSGFAGG